MSKLVSMKISKAEMEKRMEPSTIATERPMYPWGLGLNLDNDTLEKLGVDDLPKVGEVYTVVAQVSVSSVSSNESEGGKNRSVSLQITDMCLEDGKAKNVADKLYAKKD